MSSKKRITIAIPSYNQPEHLRECLESIARQTVMDSIEVIIFNDPSCSDGEIKKVVADSPISLFITLIMNKERLYSPGNIFKAASYSYTTPYLMIFHHDDTMAPRYVEMCIKLLDNHTDAAWVSSNFSFVTTENMWKFPEVDFRYFEVYHNQADIVRAILKNKKISFGPTMYRSDKMQLFVSHFKQFVERFGPCGDRPLLICTACDSKALFITQPLINYRLHAAQDSQTNTSFTPARNRNLMEFYRSFLPKSLSLPDRRLFFTFSTNNLLYAYWNLVEPNEGFLVYVKRGVKEGLISFWYLRRAGIRAFFRFLIFTIKKSFLRYWHY